MTVSTTDQLLPGESSRKLVTLRKVTGLQPHPNADRLELVSVSNCSLLLVGGKEQYSIGQYVLLFEADSVLPGQLACDVGLTQVADEPYHVQVQKLRGVRAHGYICPAKLVPGVQLDDSHLDSFDFSEQLDVAKYIKELPTQLQGVVDASGDGDLYSRGLIAKTDEERLSSNMFLLDELRASGHDVQAVLKYDGSSMTVGKYEGKLVVASRKNWLDVSSAANAGNSFVQMAKELAKGGLLDVLGEGEFLQGELCGPKIQGNKHGFEQKTFVAFQAWNSITQKFSSRASLSVLVAAVDSKHMLLAEIVKYWAAEDFANVTVEQLQQIADDAQLEGIVVSSFSDRSSSFKVLNSEY